MKQFGQKTVYFSFVCLLFVFPLFSFARSPYATELKTQAFNVPTASTATLIATGTEPYFIESLQLFSQGNAKTLKMYCDGTFLWSGVVNAQPYQIIYKPVVPMRCDGSIRAVTDFSDTDIGVGFYEMADTDFNSPTLVSTSTSSGGGGGGGTFDGVIQPESFDGFYLFFGILVFMWAWTFYVFYFRPKQ